MNTDAGWAKKKSLPLWLPAAFESVPWLIYLPVIFGWSSKMTPSKKISKIVRAVSDNYGAPQASAKSSACIQLSQN